MRSYAHGFVNGKIINILEPDDIMCHSEVFWSTTIDFLAAGGRLFLRCHRPARLRGAADNGAHSSNELCFGAAAIDHGGDVGEHRQKWNRRRRFPCPHARARFRLGDTGPSSA